MTIKKYDNSAIDLAEVDFGDYTGECTFDDGIDSGVLLNVSSWVRNEMNFGRNRYSVEVAVTARLWKTIVRISPLAKRWQTVVSRGNDALWLASYALHKARQVGMETANFQCFLPTEDDWGDECVKLLRVQCSLQEGRSVIVIGYVEEFAEL